MKISNFRMIEVCGNSPLTWRFRASVDVTTGRFFKRTKSRKIYRRYALDWYFVDSGEFTPGLQVGRLVRSFEARSGCSLSEWERT